MDQCYNIPDIQNIVPDGTFLDKSGNCLCLNGKNNPPTCTTVNDMCTNIPSVQNVIPENTMRNIDGTCTCINKADNPPTCILSCPLGQRPALIELKVMYNSGQPLMYRRPDLVNPIFSTDNSKIILSTNELMEVGQSIPLFSTTYNPFYDPLVLNGQPYLSLQRHGNTITLLLYGFNNPIIEEVSGQLVLGGDAGAKWIKVKNIAMELLPITDVPEDFIDSMEIMSDTQRVNFKMVVDGYYDAFMAEFDIENACVPCGDGKIWNPDL